MNAFSRQTNRQTDRQTDTQRIINKPALFVGVTVGTLDGEKVLVGKEDMLVGKDDELMITLLLLPPPLVG